MNNKKIKSEKIAIYKVLIDAKEDWVATYALAMKSRTLRKDINYRIYELRKELPKNKIIESRKGKGYRLRFIGDS